MPLIHTALHTDNVPPVRRTQFWYKKIVVYRFHAAIFHIKKNTRHKSIRTAWFSSNDYCQLPHCYSCKRTHVLMQTISTLSLYQYKANKQAVAVATIEIPHFPTIYRNRIICRCYCCLFTFWLCLCFMRPKKRIGSTTRKNMKKNSCVRYALFKCTTHRMEFPRRMRSTEKHCIKSTLEEWIFFLHMDEIRICSLIRSD